MPPEMPSGYYVRDESAKSFEEHLFLAGPALQSAELNEIQKRASSRLKSVADVLFRDGDIIRDAVVLVDETTGLTTCSSGAIYLRGSVRGVPSDSFTVPMGTVDIGIYLVESVIDATDDVSLKDPASGLLNYQRAGAARLKMDPVWGYDGDGTEGDFFPIYVADDRVLRPKAPPPTIDAVAQAIAAYDRDSTGGSYVVRGMVVQALPDVGANQVYSVGEGAARANGSAIEFGSARRLTFDPAPDLKGIANEPHLSAGAGSQEVFVSFTPISSVTSVTITKEVTETVTHGAFVGASDALANTSVLSLVEVKQGGTTYVAGTDYQLTANAVDWSPGGAEPATGSTYTVKYQYIATVAPDSVNDDSLFVTGAVTGTLILVTYNQKMPRIDRICLAENGTLVWLKGTSTNYNPRPPIVPATMLALASIQQTWRAVRPLTNDGVRVVPMQDIANLSNRIDYVLGLVAQQRLESSAQTRASGIIKGLFTDPFLDDSLRNAGEVQTGAIVDGILTLPIEVTPEFADTRDSGTLSALAYNHVTLIGQTARTGSMKVNPYDAFGLPLVPPEATLSPSVDRWTEVVEDFPSTRTRLMINLWWWWRPGRLVAGRRNWREWGNWWESETEVTDSVGAQTVPASTLRQITVAFDLSGFVPGETLSSTSFDGAAIAFTASGAASGSGQITGTFTIPAGIPSGTKEVVFTGSGGSVARTTFVGEGATVIETPRIRNRFEVRRIDPLAETFSLDASAQVSGVDLWFTAIGTSQIEVQIRETSNGFPTGSILTSKRLAPGAIATDGSSTRFAFDAPLFLTGGVEYAIVVLSDDAVAALAIAELGEQDPDTGQWVTAQPYQVGVLLSSSNASTWTAHQDRDMAFRLLGASFTQTSRTIALGTVAVTGATDLAVRANVEYPTDDADVQFVLTLPDASQITVAADQTVRLLAPITGNVSISAVLTGTAEVSPILFSDVQLLWGVVSGAGTYFSRYVNGGTGVVTKVVVEALLPGASTLEVAIKGNLDGAWTVLTSPTAVQVGDGWVELTYVSGALTKDQIATRLTLGGTTAARPALRNLRMLVE